MATEGERRAYAAKIAKEWADKGKLVEGGWVAFDQFYLRGVPDAERERLRLAWFTSAQHLWRALFMSLEDGPGEAPHELQRMANVEGEIVAFEMSLVSGHKAGSA